jgi:gamma-glutamyltranspeptidase/glutathione hydrolase
LENRKTWKIFISLTALILVATDVAARVRPTTENKIIVAAAHPLAVEAGMQILRQGGDAIDAAIAVQTMLGLVEPQSSGLGGGAFLLRYDAMTRRVEVYDGRETAPASAHARMFLNENGQVIPRAQAMTSGLATGVPGVVAMLKLAHSQHGKLAWNNLFSNSVRAAQEGFQVSARLDRFAHAPFPQNNMPDVRRYFTKENGEIVRQGDVLKNPAYGAFVEKLASEGPSALYQGEVAEAISNRVAEAPMPARMTMNEISNYRALKRQPICANYHALVLCTAPPPSSGVSLLQLVLMLEGTNIHELGVFNPQSWYLFAQASRLMYADRDAFIGDPAFVNVPVQGLINRKYVRSRRALIEAGTPPISGNPPRSRQRGIDATIEPGGTSHFVIRDSFGNAVSMTTTVESFFGSGRMVHGFFLNNQMTDFSLVPEGPNAIAPGKRPRSSMSPIIILDRNGNLIGALGSPGGSAILAYVGKTLIGLFEWDMSMQAAMDLPNLVARGAQANGEVARMAPEVISSLNDKGIAVRAGSGEDSGLHGFIFRDNAWQAGADKRRDGTTAIE